MNDLCKQSCNCKWHVNAYNVKYVGTDKPLGYCTCAKWWKQLSHMHTTGTCTRMLYKCVTTEILRIHRDTQETQNIFLCYTKARLHNSMCMQLWARMETSSAKLKMYICVRTEPCVYVYTNTVTCSNVYDKNVKLSVTSTNSLYLNMLREASKYTNADIGNLQCNPLS